MDANRDDCYKSWELSRKVRQLKPVKHWPACVQFVSRNLWEQNIPKKLAQAYKPHGSAREKPSKFVRISSIDDSQHPAHGQHGLFAAKKIKKNQWILDYFGNVQLIENESKTSDYVLKYTDELSIDAEFCGNEARFLNDYRGIGVQPNVKFDTRVKENGELVMSIFAVRDVKKGQELLVSYGKGFWRERGLLGK